jgi:hypothetical protein
MVNVNELLRQVLELETDNLLATGIVVDWRRRMCCRSYRATRTNCARCSST